MRIHQTTLYTFPELSDKAKEKAVENWLMDGSYEFFDSAEWGNTLEKFCDLTGIKTKDWEVGAYGRSYCRGNFDRFEPAVLGLSGLRARTWLINNWLPLFSNLKVYYLPGSSYQKKRKSRITRESDWTYGLTGFYSDYSILQPVQEFITKGWAGSETLADVFQACLDGWVSGYVAAIEDTQSFEYISDYLTVNEYEFTVDGKIH